jgi:TorA maturation chaperone TorD
MTGQPITVQPQLAPEDQARAEFYALLGRLFSAAPDAAVLAALGASETWPDEGGDPLADAWNRLVLASRAMDAEAAEQEHTDLFVGVGKAECNLHASYWMRDAAEPPLAAIRGEFAGLGLARRHGSALYEDHLAALFETMRILICGADGRPPTPIAVQRDFFNRWIGPWALDCCAAVTQSQIANYYRCVAQFTCLFLAVERDSLAIE